MLSSSQDNMLYFYLKLLQWDLSVPEEGYFCYALIIFVEIDIKVMESVILFLADEVFTST
jgi:hypothetical protein